MVKMFPQYLLPRQFDSPALSGCVLSLVLGATGAEVEIPRDWEVEKRAVALKSFQDGEALADAIITYGPFSPIRDQ